MSPVKWQDAPESSSQKAPESSLSLAIFPLQPAQHALFKHEQIYALFKHEQIYALLETRHDKL